MQRHRRLLLPFSQSGFPPLESVNYVCAYGRRLLFEAGFQRCAFVLVIFCAEIPPPKEPLHLSKCSLSYSRLIVIQSSQSQYEVNRFPRVFSVFNRALRPGLHASPSPTP